MSAALQLARPRGAVLHRDIYPHTAEWFDARCGLLTASEMKLILTPTLKIASNDKERAHFYELLAQRITKFVEPTFQSFDMLRGQEDEAEAVALYSEHVAPTELVGFITNDKWGFTIGYSPDALVGADGLIECKSRKQKFQVETFLINVVEGTVPADFLFQCQTGLLVSERRWLDFVSYSGGLPMAVIRVWPDPEIQDAIVTAASAFEARIAAGLARWRESLAIGPHIPTTRRIQEIYAS